MFRNSAEDLKAADSLKKKLAEMSLEKPLPAPPAPSAFIPPPTLPVKP
jgi:hypothetical protein